MRTCVHNLQPQRAGDGAVTARIRKPACLQGATCFGLSRCDLDPPLADLSNLAAFDSLVVGELPAMRGDEVENLLAAFGLLGAPISLESQPGWDRLADRCARCTCG